MGNVRLEKKVLEEIPARKQVEHTFPPFSHRLFEPGTRLLTDPSKRIKIRRKRFSADSVLRVFHSANRFDLFFSPDTSHLTVIYVINYKLPVIRIFDWYREEVAGCTIFSVTGRKEVPAASRGKADRIRWKEGKKLVYGFVKFDLGTAVKDKLSRYLLNAMKIGFDTQFSWDFCGKVG